MVSVSSSKERLILFSALNGSLGIFLFSYSISVFNSVQEVLQKHIFPDASVEIVSLFASSPLLGAVIGMLFTKKSEKICGAKITMILTTLISIVGVILTMLPNILLFIFGRVLTCFEGSISTVLVHIYITQTCQDPLRGQLGNIPNLISALGTLVAFLLGGLMPIFIQSANPHIGYRLLLGLPALIALIKIFYLTFLFKFEMSFNLLNQYKESACNNVLKLFNDDGLVGRLQQIIYESDCLYKESYIPWKELLKPRYIKSFMVSIPFSIVIASMGGIGPLIFSNMMFSEGIETSYPTSTLILTNCIGVLGVLGSLISLIYFKHDGRRRNLVLFGTSLLACINIVIALLIHFGSINNMAVKIMILVWVFVATSTIIPIRDLCVAEILPELGVEFINTFGMIFGFMMIQLFIPLKLTVGYAGLYLMFSCLTALLLIIFVCCFLETKDIPKLEIYRLYEELSDEDLILVGKVYSSSPSPV